MTPDTASPPPPPPPPPPGPPPAGPQARLTRRAEGEDRILGGVASGLADHFGLDPVVVRIGFVLFALFGGGGVALYLVLWILVPARDQGEAVAQRFLREGQARVGSDRGVGFWIGSALIAIAGIAILDEFVDSTLAWALVLIAVGVVLFQGDRGEGPLAGIGRPGDGGDPAAAPTDDLAAEPPTDALPADALPADALPADALHAEAWSPPPPAPSALAPPPPPARPHRPRQRSVLGRLTLGLAALWVGGALLFNGMDLGTHVTLAGIVGVALAIVGAGLVVGAWFGRARWLVVVAALLVPALLAATFADGLGVPRSAGVGERHLDVRPGTTVVDEELFAGELRIHLTDLGPDHPDVSVRGHVGLGVVEVVVPPGWGVDLRARVRGGDIRLTGYAEYLPGATGLDAEVVHSIAPAEPGLPTATLDLATDWGEVHVILEDAR